jgi:hypothetical protein
VPTVEIWKPQPHVAFRVCKRLGGGLLYLLLYLQYGASYICVLISLMFIELKKTSYVFKAIFLMEYQVIIWQCVLIFSVVFVYGELMNH